MGLLNRKLQIKNRKSIDIALPTEPFLDFSSPFLHSAFDLLSRISFHGAGDIIGFAFDLLDLTGNNIFFSHEKLLVGELRSWCKRRADSGKGCQPNPEDNLSTHI